MAMMCPSWRSTAESSLRQSLDIIIAEVGVEGGITFTAGFEPQRSAGPGWPALWRRSDRQSGNPFCIFDLSGQLSADLSAYARLGIGWFSVTEHYPIASVTLIDFEVELCSPDQLTLAHVNGSTLFLHIGVDSTLPGEAARIHTW